MESFIWPCSLSMLVNRIMTKLTALFQNEQPWSVSFRLCAKPQTDERMQPNCITWWIDSSDHNLTCRAARRSYDVCETMGEKLNSAFQIAGCRSSGGEWDHVFVRKIHRWVINASCASEAKHIRKQSWSCQAGRTFHAEKRCDFTRKWEYTGWNEATVHWRAHILIQD